MNLSDEMRVKVLLTSTNRSNAIMQRFLERRGYVRSGIIENLDPGDPELVYYKRLADDGPSNQAPASPQR